VISSTVEIAEATKLRPSGECRVLTKLAEAAKISHIRPAGMNGADKDFRKRI